MDEIKLRQLWQNYIIHQPKDHEEKRRCLTKLLDTCLIYFSKLSEISGLKRLNGTSERQQHFTAHTCIGKWLIHQFIIDFDVAYSNRTNFNCEFDLLNDYFINNIGGKFLKCIYHLNDNDNFLYDFKLIQILVPILKQYFCIDLNEDTNNEGYSFKFKHLTLDLNLFIDKYKFNEQAFLKSLKTDILSPVKVKSWIKTTRSSSNVQTNTRRSKKIMLGSEPDSDEDEFYIPRHRKKYHNLNDCKLFCLSKTNSEELFEDKCLDATTELFNTNISSVENEDCLKQTKSDIICTLIEILIDFVQFENKHNNPLLNGSLVKDSSIPEISFLIVEELSPILVRLVNETKFETVSLFKLITLLKNLIVVSCMAISQVSAGIKLIYRCKIFETLLKLMSQISCHLGEPKYSNDFCRLLRIEFFETFGLTIRLLIQVSHFLVYTEEFLTFSTIMNEFFYKNSENMLLSLIIICESQVDNESNGNEYEFVYRIVDLLLQLQVTLQRSQSLHLHKKLCSKKRHNKCDLTPLMVHHFYHETVFAPTKISIPASSQSVDALLEYPCCISMIYHTLFNLIFICSKRSSPNIEKLICYICNHLCLFISCCWSLKFYFKRLLYFAISSNRSNILRSAIFNVIEFNIKIQRRHLFSSGIIMERCNFCTYKDICDSGISNEIITEYNNKDSTNSEGYLTDNSSFVMTKSVTTHTMDHCSNSNCLIKALAIPYINLLKSEDVTIRQTVFRHFFNLFSYFSTNSKLSLMFHIIFPVFQNYNDFPLDVCAFILRLFIVLSDASNHENENLNLLVAFNKVDGLSLLKQLIVNVQLVYIDCYDHEHNENTSKYSDLSLHAIRLLENFIKKELLYFKSNQNNIPLDCARYNEIMSNCDPNTLTTVTMLVDLYLGQFSICTKSNLMHHYQKSALVKPVTLPDYIEYYKKTSFNLSDMQPTELANLYNNLICLLKLLSTSNVIMNHFDFFRYILNHDSFRFTERLFSFFQKFLQQVLNEVKLFRLLFYQQQTSTTVTINNKVDTIKYAKFFSKIMKTMEQLLLFLLKMEPFYVDNNLQSASDISLFIQRQLSEFNDDENLLQWNCAGSPIEPMLDLFKMFINISFDHNQDVRCYLKSEIDELVSLDISSAHHTRSSSFDSLISENDANNELNVTEMDHYDCGYEADAEYAFDLTKKVKRKDDFSSQNECSIFIPNKVGPPLLKYMDICRVVIRHIGESFDKTSQLCGSKRLSKQLLQHQYNSILSIINLISKYCKENSRNCQILFDNQFTIFILACFKLMLNSSNAEEKAVKLAIFDLFIEISKIKLCPDELKLFIDLFKSKNADYEFLLGILYKLLFSKNSDIAQPRYCVRYPTIKPLSFSNGGDQNKLKNWIDTVIFSINQNCEINENEMLSFKSLACALPIKSTHIVNHRFSIVFWINMHKIQPLINKFKANNDYYDICLENNDSVSSASENRIIKNVNLIHLISVAFNASTIELWFDYTYNRFVYRICKISKQGKLVYSSENFITNQSNLLGKWNFIRVNVDEDFVSKSRTRILRIAHSVNCSKDKIVKLSYPVNVFDKSVGNVGLLIGSNQSISPFYYKLGNVLLFKEHLQSTSNIFLYSLGPDFSQLHHLKSKSILSHNYFVLPKQLAKDDNVDIISSMFHCTTSSAESQTILNNIIVLYKASEPSIYFTYSNNEINDNASFSFITKPFSKMYLNSSSNNVAKTKSLQMNGIRKHSVLFYGSIETENHYGICKTIADSGGVSIFIFMFCYLIEKCESQAVYQRSLEILLRIYESHYYHRFAFDNHCNGYQLIVHTLEKSNKTFSPVVLRIFSQFSMDNVGNNSLILSSNIGIFLNSWKVWIKNSATMKLFYSTLYSLVKHTNPYRNFNLAQLRKVNAFAALLRMIEDVYINFFDNYSYLDVESLDNVILVLRSMIDSTADLKLLQSIFNCILLLHKSELLHVNQTRASFYYLFPSTWLTQKDNLEEHHIRLLTVSDQMNDSDGDDQVVVLRNEEMETQTNLSLDYWEIVSEIVEASVSYTGPKEKEKSQAVASKSNYDYAICELILLIDKLLEQLSDTSTVETIFDKMFCLDFLIVFINNPSERVREVALTTFFKFYNLYYNNNASSPIHPTENSQNKTITKKTLYLLLVTNQLYNYLATDEIVSISLGFLLNLNRRCTTELLNNEDDTLLRQTLQNISLEKCIPFLALIPKCAYSIQFCHKTLLTFHQILNALSIEQICEIQQEYGLIQSLSKVIINFNSQVSLNLGDFNNFTKDQVNEEIYKIFRTISLNYILKDGPEYFYQFIGLIHYFSIMERKVSIEISPVFRQVQISILQAAFESAVKLEAIYDGKVSINSNYGDSDVFKDYTTSDTKIIELTKANKRDLVVPREMVERLKFIVKKSTNFIICRDDLKLTQKEVFFQREALYHLLDIVEKAENLHPKSNSRHKRTTWSNLLNNAKDFFKDQLSQLLLFLVSPFQKVENRIFSLYLFVEKTNSLENVKQFLLKNNEKFCYLFLAFLVDLMDSGIKTINIYNLQKYSDQCLPPLFSKNYSDSPPPQDSPSIEFVFTKFKEKMNLKIKTDPFYNKSEIAAWYSQIEDDKVEYGQTVLKHINKIFSNMSLVYTKVLESATLLNDRVIIAQHQEKKQYIEHLKEESARQNIIKKQLFNLINELVHEKSVWHLKEHYPQSWALSPFESANRVRKRLERCFLEIDPRYVLIPTSKQLRSKCLFASLLDTKSNPFTQISLTLNDYDNSTSTLNSSLLYTTSARVILFDEEIEGEILLTNKNIKFVANQNGQNKDRMANFCSLKTFFNDFVINFNEIEELTKCRYELQNTSIEIFLNTGLTYLIVFESSSIRDDFAKHLTSNKDLLPNLIESLNLVTLTQMWRERRISNFEYLTNLNKLSGRTFNDLMQYPVFPFVIADYHSDILNLKKSTSFRNLSRPIAVQKKEREKHYVDQYNYIKSENERNPIYDKNDVNSFQYVVTSAPYHYGAHYSNSGIILHYLVRLPPYTQMFLHYQDKNFDIPDRTFHSIQTTWRLATEDSTNGFKELIPEFFYLPEILMNNENFNFGVRQNGERVDNVVLPPWCRNNARLFTMINRQALESNYVTLHLNHWIDLIFGFQQSGKAAVDAVNVFHPATHFSSDLSKITDDVKRQAIKTMIKTFGQMPTQLFNMPHPSISPDIQLPIELDPEIISNSPSMGEVIGLKWGNYVGSPIFPKPKVYHNEKLSKNIEKLCILQTNEILLLPKDSCLLATYNQQRNIFINTLYMVSYFLCTWSGLNSTILFKNEHANILFTHENLILDKFCLCESIPGYDWLLIGYESGIIVAFSLKTFKNTADKIEIKKESFLIGHSSAITTITINKHYSIALTTDCTGTAILWDMNKPQFVRTIVDGNSSSCPLKLSCISDTLGDLALVAHTHDDEQRIMSSKLSIFTINGQIVGDIYTKKYQPYITSLCYSTATEGLSINVVATGLSNGTVKLWSTWDLTLVRDIKLNSIHLPIKSIAYSLTNDFLYLLYEDNDLFILHNPTLSSSQNSTSSSSNKNPRIMKLNHL